MTLRNILAAIATGLVIIASTVPAMAGNTNDGSTKKGQRASALKKTEQTQGTFAYRYGTYSSYTSSTSLCDPLTSATCTTQLNDDLRTNSGSTLFPSVKPSDPKKPSNPNAVKKANTKDNE